MVVKVLVVGDPHFKVNNIPETEILVRRVIELAKEHRPDRIVCLGDILDRHETIHVVPLDKATDFLYQCSLIAPTVLLVGNHDRPNNNHFLTSDHPFGALKYWRNMTIADRPVVDKVGDQNFLYMPYVPPGRFLEAIETVLPKERLGEIDCIYAHQEFYGVHMGPMVSEAGDRWDESLPLVVSGHIHDAQVLQSNILYVGTPFQQAFGESEDKTLSMFSFTKGEPWKRVKFEVGVPKKLIYRCSVEQYMTYVPPDNAQIKIIVSCSNTEYKSLMKHQKTKKLQTQGVKIQWKSTKEYKQITLESRKTYTERLKERLEAVENGRELMAMYQKLLRRE